MNFPQQINDFVLCSHTCLLPTCCVLRLPAALSLLARLPPLMFLFATFCFPEMSFGFATPRPQHTHTHLDLWLLFLFLHGAVIATHPFKLAPSVTVAPIQIP